jgi:microcystin-dependent protein
MTTKIKGTEGVEFPDSSVQATSAVFPPGTIIDFGGAGIPAGFLRCNGVAVDRTTYAPLFAAIGIEWGAGDGSTTFNLPDFAEGESAVATTTGANLADATNGQVIDHVHPLGGTVANLSLGGTNWGNNGPLNSGVLSFTSGVSGAPAKNLAAGRKVFKLIKT